MPRLSFVSDAELEKAVQHLLQVAHTAKAAVLKDINRNVVDPFSILFQMSGFEISADEWQASEMTRQAEKTLQNHVGMFHQNILGGVKGWKNLEVGQIIDLESIDQKVIAEVKNKYNTVSGGKLVNVYCDLESQVMPKHSKYKGFTAYYVEIIPKKPQRFNIEFTPSDKSVGGRCPANPLVRKIDGASFYDLITGEKHALRQLFDILPDVIEEVCKNTNAYKFDDRTFAKSFFSEAFGQ
jgi:Eco47II restriction endonuclease